MPERLEFNSRSPFEIHHILNDFKSLTEHSAHADLHLPEGEGPFCCIVAVHGSRGWSNHHEDPCPTLVKIRNGCLPDTSVLSTICGICS